MKKHVVVVGGWGATYGRSVEATGVAANKRPRPCILPAHSRLPACPLHKTVRTVPLREERGPFDVSAVREIFRDVDVKRMESIFFFLFGR